MSEVKEHISIDEMGFPRIITVFPIPHVEHELNAPLKSAGKGAYYLHNQREYFDGLNQPTNFFEVESKYEYMHGGDKRDEASYFPIPHMEALPYKKKIVTNTAPPVSAFVDLDQLIAYMADCGAKAEQEKVIELKVPQTTIKQRISNKTKEILNVINGRFKKILRIR